MADFCIFIEFHKISTKKMTVSIISIWQIMLLLYSVSSLYLFEISIFYMEINLTTAMHCGVLFQGVEVYLSLLLNKPHFNMVWPNFIYFNIKGIFWNLLYLPEVLSDSVSPLPYKESRCVYLFSVESPILL